MSEAVSAPERDPRGECCDLALELLRLGEEDEADDEQQNPEERSGAVPEDAHEYRPSLWELPG